MNNLISKIISLFKNLVFKNIVEIGLFFVINEVYINNNINYKLTQCIHIIMCIFSTILCYSSIPGRNHNLNNYGVLQNIPIILSNRVLNIILKVTIISLTDYSIKLFSLSIIYYIIFILIDFFYFILIWNLNKDIINLQLRSENINYKKKVIYHRKIISELLSNLNRYSEKEKEELCIICLDNYKIDEEIYYYTDEFSYALDLRNKGYVSSSWIPLSSSITPTPDSYRQADTIEIRHEGVLTKEGIANQRQIILEASSISWAFKSFIFCLAISSNCFLVIEATIFLPGSCDPLLSFTASFIK